MSTQIPLGDAVAEVLDGDQLRLLRRFGRVRVRPAAAGEVLQREGQVPRTFYTVVAPLGACGSGGRASE